MMGPGRLSGEARYGIHRRSERTPDGCKSRIGFMNSCFRANQPHTGTYHRGPDRLRWYHQRDKDMYKIGQKVNVRLADGKTRKATIMETAVPDLFHTHTHTHTCWS